MYIYVCMFIYFTTEIKNYFIIIQVYSVFLIVALKWPPYYLYGREKQHMFG